jgi:hypothetical protein
MLMRTKKACLRKTLGAVVVFVVLVHVHFSDLIYAGKNPYASTQKASLPIDNED